MRLDQLVTVDSPSGMLRIVKPWKKLQNFVCELGVDVYGGVFVAASSNEIGLSAYSNCHSDNH